MIKSLSVSSEGSLPPLDDDVESVCSDELLGSQSRRWLADLLTGDMPPESADVNTVGRDGLFVDYHFPLGELEMQPSVKWRRPKVKRKLTALLCCGGLKATTKLLTSVFKYPFNLISTTRGLTACRPADKRASTER